MTNGVRCQSYIFDGFSRACEVADIINLRYPVKLLTAVTGRVLSVGIIDPVFDESDVDGIVQMIAEEWHSEPKYL